MRVWIFVVASHQKDTYGIRILCLREPNLTKEILAFGNGPRDIISVILGILPPIISFVQYSLSGSSTDYSAEADFVLSVVAKPVVYHLA